jgi:hypothetical protein
MTIAERFWAKVDVRGSDDCWLWQGARDVNGYGRLILDGRNEKAHRVALALDGRPVSSRKEYACHTCDVKACVNPRHLYVGNASTNVRDAIERGLFRPRRVFGSGHHGARLTEAMVRDLRTRYAAGGVTHRQLAREFGVAQGTISRAITGRLWSHV